MNEIKALIERNGNSEAIDTWNILAALGDPDMFYALQAAGYHLANDADINPDTLTKEQLLDMADDLQANMIVIDVKQHTSFSNGDASKFFHDAETIENRNIFVFSIQDAFTRSIYEQIWEAGRIVTSATPDDLAFFVGVCMGAINQDARRQMRTRAESNVRPQGGAPTYGMQKSYAPPPEYDESQDEQGYYREAVEGDDLDEDPYSDGEPMLEEKGGITGLINRVIKDDTGKISVRGWIVLGALAALILLLFIPSGKTKEPEPEPAIPAVADASQVPEGSVPEEGVPEEGDPEAEDEPADGQQAEDEPSDDEGEETEGEETEGEDGEEEEGTESQDEGFEPVSEDPIEQAQRRYDELLAAFAAADTNNVEMHMCDNFSIGIIGCAATYDVNDKDIAVAAFKVENTGSEAIVFYDDMYACATQDGVPLTIDTAFLQGEAAAGATTPIQPGQTAIVYQAYQMANSTSQLIISAESWDAEEVAQERPYQIS